MKHFFSWSFAIALGTAVAAAQDSPLPVALVITNADGRVVSAILGSRPYRSWTAIIQPVASATPDLGTLELGTLDLGTLDDLVPVNFIEYFAEREQGGVRVEVSSRSGMLHWRRRSPFARVLVAPAAPVDVTELRTLGIEPVRLSLEPVGPLALSPPLIDSNVPSLDVWMDDIITDGPPRYKLTVRNRSWRSVRSFAVETFRDRKRATIGYQDDLRSVPIVAPTGTYTFYVSSSSAPAGDDAPGASAPLERIVISSLLFDDLSEEGDAALAARLLVLEAGRAVQLRRVVDVWELGVPADCVGALTALRTRVASLPTAVEPEALERATSLARPLVPHSEIEPILQAGMQNAKDLVLADVRDLEDVCSGDAPALSSQLRRLRASYTDWLLRLKD